MARGIKASIILGAWVMLAVSVTDVLAQGVNSTGGNFPQSTYDSRRESRGSLTGDDGISIGGARKEEGGGGGIGVNSFLWRATLDTLSFMPLASADPFGGVIITDWYESPDSPGERFKVNALILDKTLRVDGIKITVFKQKLDTRGQWRDQKTDEGLGHKLEDTVLTRARQLRVTSR
jgi:hypothetical protein